MYGCIDFQKNSNLPTMDSTCAYEIARLERIARNEQVLLDLGLMDAANKISQPTTKKRKQTTKKRRRSSKKRKIPTRRSRRGMVSSSEVQLESLPDTWNENQIIGKNNTGVKRPDIFRFKYARLSRDQSKKLREKVGDFEGLSTTELNAAKKASETISAGFEVAGRKMKGDEYYVRARNVIVESGCRIVSVIAFFVVFSLLRLSISHLSTHKQIQTRTHTAILAKRFGETNVLQDGKYFDVQTTHNVSD